MSWNIPDSRKQFLSTPSARRATIKPRTLSFLKKYFYPRPPRGGRPAPATAEPTAQPISIHALREEGDNPRTPPRAHGLNFYPRPPRGGRPCQNIELRRIKIFLSTPSARRATTRAAATDNTEPISIHALREEGDPAFVFGPDLWVLFLSTPSARRATASRRLPLRHKGISIHALREEGDFTVFCVVINIVLFLSTPSARRAT